MFFTALIKGFQYTQINHLPKTTVMIPQVLKKAVFIMSILVIIGLYSCKKELSCEECLHTDQPSSNHPPVAKAGNDTTVMLPDSTVNLNGSLSLDPDNNITGYVWTEISGPS